MATEFPPVPTVNEIQHRLREIFPDGTPQRNYCVREMAAKTVFVMLYAGAVEGADRWLRPDQVTRMTDAQAHQTSRKARASWVEASLQPSRKAVPGRWYAQNTREPIRDETIREGLIPMGAIIERSGLPVTSPKPRYALAADFARLFTPELKGEDLDERSAGWRRDHLSVSALARVQILRRHVVETDEGVIVRFPNGETRRMSAGPSSLISREVIERFAVRFLGMPGVIFLSESRNKVVARDEKLADAIGLNIKTDQNLPDIILVDLEPKNPLLVFIEVVVSDGPVSERRKRDLLSMVVDSGFAEEDAAFVTAYSDRSHRAFKRTVQSLAWGSFAWFASEPNNLVHLCGGDKRGALPLRLIIGSRDSL